MTPPWLQPLATLAAGLFVLCGAGVTIRQRHRADRKAQWWNRTQWAVDHLLRDPDGLAGELGFRVMQEQSGSRTADREDRALLTMMIDMRLALRRVEVHTEDDGADRE